MATRPVGNDSELELPGSHVGLERRPRIFLLGCDIEAFFKGRGGTRIGNAAGKHQCGDHTECDKRHKGKSVHEKLQKGVEIASDCYLLGAFNTGQERSGDPHQNFLRDRMNCLHYDGMDAIEEDQIWAGCSTNESASGQVYLNISKGGLSLSFQRKGGSVNIGKNGPTASGVSPAQA